MEIKIRNMLVDIFKELGIKYTFLSKEWIIMLERDGKTRFLAGYKSSLNDHALGSVVDDKYALFDVLQTKGLPVCKYEIVYGVNNSNDYAQGCNNVEYVKDYYMNHNQRIVLKPNDGTCGKDVYRVNNLEELEELYNKLTRKYYSINMGPYYDIKNEYRFIVFNDEVRIAYKKNKPVVYGDGVKTIRELLMEFNSRYFNDKLEDAYYSRILNKGEEFEYNWKFNLSQGSVATEIDNSVLYEELKQIALNAAREVGLKFGSVDIIVTMNGEKLILEMNSGVMVENYIEQFANGYEKAKELYKDVIESMFR